MGMLALLLPLPAKGLAIDACSTARLAALGVTRVCLLEDDTSVGVVFEGWAFEPERSAAAVRAALLVADGSDVRELRGVANLHVAPSAHADDNLLEGTP